MMRKEFLIFGNPAIEQPEIDEVVDSLKSGWLGTGPKVQRFENLFKNYKGTKHAVAVNSCTAALHLSMLALGIGPGDEVLVPTMTFAATANAVIHTGGIPVLVDCRRETMNIDLDDMKRKITPQTKAVIPVHFAGRPCEMDDLVEFSTKSGIKIIEDCAHAVEAEYKGRKIGTIGEMGCFSFYVTKNIVTGEGGMVISENENYVNQIKTLAQHGMSMDAWKRFSDEGYKHYQVVFSGYKYNMMDIQAALGIHQLPRVEKNWNRRKEIWDRYNKAFSQLPVIIPLPTESDVRHSHHLYTLLLEIERVNLTRDQFLEEMKRHNIGVGVHYIALHLHPFYQENFNYRRGDFPDAEWISDRTM